MPRLLALSMTISLVTSRPKRGDSQDTNCGFKHMSTCGNNVLFQSTTPAIHEDGRELPRYTLSRTPVAVLESRSEIGSFQQRRTQNDVCNMQWTGRRRKQEVLISRHANRTHVVTDYIQIVNSRHHFVNGEISQMYVRPSCEVVVILDESFSTYVRPRPGKFLFS